MKALIDHPNLYLWVDDPAFRKKTWMPKSWKLLRHPYPRRMRDANHINWQAHGIPRQVLATVESAVVTANLLQTYFSDPTKLRLSFRWSMALHDKYFMKHHARKNGIRVIPWVWSGSALKRDWFLQQLSPAAMLVVKDRRESGSKNLRVISRAEYVPQKNQLIEVFLDAHEYSIETYTQNGTPILQNITEYRIKKHLNVVPAPISEELEQKILAFNQKILAAFGVRDGLTHVEIYLDSRGQLYFGEIAHRPPGGYIMDLLQIAYGVDPWKLFADTIIANTLPPIAHAPRTAAAWVIHPGQGKIARIRGATKVLSMPECVKLRMTGREGETMKKRKRLSEEFGHLILAAPTHKELNSAIDFALKTLRIEMDLHDAHQ